ncbi:MAG: GIY-YIG nuclease family protein [Candidatus Magasanikbacteria bacterium]
MQNLIEKVKRFPTEPGIYLFYNKTKELIYIGKATSLRNRVQSYFRGARSMRPIEQMMHEVVDIKIKQTDSVLEAVILEANYIKKFLPKYNVEGKDDRSWNYIVVTTDEFSQVLYIRQHEMDLLKHKNIKTLKQSEEKTNKNKSGKISSLKQVKHLFGPYPGLKTREMMKLLQRLFFISTCKPGQKRECLYYQIGQCLGVCTGEISSREYKSKVILPLVTFLRGGKKKLIKSLEIKMRKFSKQEDFEEAGRLRNQINSLLKIHDIALLNKTFVEDDIRITNDPNVRINRIEGYDISNLGSTGKVGSMVVFDGVEAQKKDYRKFKIKTVEGQSDVDCLCEVLERRLAHANIRISNDSNVRIINKKDIWPLPDIFLIDGGKPQVSVAMSVLKKYKLNIPLVGIAKGPERKRNDFIFGNKDREFIKFVNNNQDLLIRVRDEAHRFAITFQRSLRGIKR